MLTHLAWLKSKENNDRMEEKGMQKSGIVHDGLMMLFDFAEEEGVSLIEMLDWLVLGVANQRGGQVRDDFHKVWQTVQPLSRRDFLKRKGVSK